MFCPKVWFIILCSTFKNFHEQVCIKGPKLLMDIFWHNGWSISKKFNRSKFVIIVKKKLVNLIIMWCLMPQIQMFIIVWVTFDFNIDIFSKIIIWMIVKFGIINQYMKAMHQMQFFLSLAKFSLFIMIRP